MKAGQNETLSSGSGSSPSSTLLTSPPSKTPSNAPPVTIIEVPKDAIKVVLQTQPEPTLGLPQIMAGWAGPVVALIAIYAVHRLTQLRDKEKAVFELLPKVQPISLLSPPKAYRGRCVHHARRRWSSARTS